MKFGILIPTYNRREYLESALASAVAQVGAATEILVIDNGSTDGTADFMARIANPRVRYVRNDANIGVSGSVNRGVRLLPADVEWCTVLCDDDTLAPGFVQSSCRFIRSREPEAIVDCRKILVDPEGRKIRETRKAPTECSALEYLRGRSRFMRETFLTGLSFHRGAFDAIGGYPSFTTGAGTDDAFIFLLSLRDRLYMNRDAVAHIRVHEGAESWNPSLALSHMETTGEFRKFILLKANESGSFSAAEMDHLERMVRRYEREMNDALWIIAAKGIPGTSGNPAAERRRLLAAARENRFPVTARTRLNAFFLEKTGILPESFRVWRRFWQVAKGLGLLRR